MVRLKRKKVGSKVFLSKKKDFSGQNRRFSVVLVIFVISPFLCTFQPHFPPRNHPQLPRLHANPDPLFRLHHLHRHQLLVLRLPTRKPSTSNRRRILMGRTLKRRQRITRKPIPLVSLPVHVTFSRNWLRYRSS